MKGRLLISFSGGRTSGYMTKRLLDEMSDTYDVQVVFANTGQEDERTLEFVHNCDKHFGFNTVWLETKVYHGERKGSGFNVVDFETASRSGKPYEEVTKKFGLANKVSPHCTREMKQRPITAYARSLGWANGTYDLAIGIRIDEIDRMNSKAPEARIIYPLVKWKVDKPQILDWWAKQPFDLDLPEHRGNCLWCWKKSNRKLFTLALEDPSVFDFPKYLEDTYSMYGPVAKKNGLPMKIFRGNVTTEELLFEAAKQQHKPFVDNYYLDMNQGCEDSCEVFSTEQDVEDMLKEA